MGDYIRSGGRRKICQRQLRLDNNTCQYYVPEREALILEKETYRVERA